jgi:hypothetical protein
MVTLSIFGVVKLSTGRLESSGEMEIRKCLGFDSGIAIVRNFDVYSFFYLTLFPDIQVEGKPFS